MRVRRHYANQMHCAGSVPQRSSSQPEPQGSTQLPSQEGFVQPLGCSHTHGIYQAFLWPAQITTAALSPAPLLGDNKGVFCFVSVILNHILEIMQFGVFVAIVDNNSYHINLIRKILRKFIFFQPNFCHLR